MEDRERFDCDREAKKKYANEKAAFDHGDHSLERQLNELMKRLKSVEDKLSKQKDGQKAKRGGFDESEIVSIVEEHAWPKIKKSEKKIKKYFT